MKPKYVKKLLFSEIKSISEKSDEYCISPGEWKARTYQMS